MTRLPVALTAAALALAACTPPAAPADPSARPAGRAAATAPVRVGAVLAADSGRVTVTFEADAEDVRIELFGAGGLAVTTSEAPVDGARFARGEAVTLEVGFAPGPGRSSLVVAVNGKFKGGARRAAVANFDVGEPTAEQRQGPGAVVELPGGERLHVVGSGK